MSAAAARCAAYGSARRRYAQTPTTKPSRSRCLTQDAPYEGGLRRRARRANGTAACRAETHHQLLRGRWVSARGAATSSPGLATRLNPPYGADRHESHRHLRSPRGRRLYRRPRARDRAVADGVPQAPAPHRRRGRRRQDRGRQGARRRARRRVDPAAMLQGLDQNAALYEWNYQRQLLAIKAREGDDADVIEEHIFSERYLLERPLLAAIRRIDPPVLLIDEIDRADEEFEAFLLELLSDFQVSIPEFGTVTATSIPRVVLTSNGTRELSDALRRRCLYHYLDFPDIDREARIITARLPHIDAALAQQVAQLVAAIRKEDLRKVPGVAETLDWAATLAGLEAHDLRQTPETVHETMMCLLKTHEDRSRVTREVTDRLLGKVA